jgi:hypothetical protein
VKRPAPTGADRRPRIHIWPKQEGAAFSIGPCGMQRDQPTIGRAVDLALASIGHVPAVIIYEGVAADALLAQHMGETACG